MPPPLAASLEAVTTRVTIGMSAGFLGRLASTVAVRPAFGMDSATAAKLPDGDSTAQRLSGARRPEDSNR